MCVGVCLCVSQMALSDGEWCRVSVRSGVRTDHEKAVSHLRVNTFTKAGSSRPRGQCDPWDDRRPVVRGPFTQGGENFFNGHPTLSDSSSRASHVWRMMLMMLMMMMELMMWMALALPARESKAATRRVGTARSRSELQFRLQRS